MSTRRTELESSLASAVRELPDLELEVITHVATRAVMGLHNGYGPLAERLYRVPWEKDASEEMIDTIFYLTAAIFAQMKAR